MVSAAFAILTDFRLDGLTASYFPSTYLHYNGIPRLSICTSQQNQRFIVMVQTVSSEFLLCGNWNLSTNLMDLHLSVFFRKFSNMLLSMARLEWLGSLDSCWRSLLTMATWFLSSATPKAFVSCYLWRKICIARYCVNCLCSFSSSALSLWKKLWKGQKNNTSACWWFKGGYHGERVIALILGNEFYRCRVMGRQSSHSLMADGFFYRVQWLRTLIRIERWSFSYLLRSVISSLYTMN